VAETKTPRRFYLHQRIEARAACDDSEGVWRAKQEAQPGTPLPDDFPSHDALEAVGYETEEDLDGADARELVECASLTVRQAEDVIAALAAL
jgi:hypothetical protein